MSEAPRSEMTKKPILYRIPEMDAVTIRKDVPFRDGAGGSLTLDMYLPPSLRGSPIPVVIFVSGYSDPALQAFLGCRLKEWESYITWARLIAASGMAAITYTTREPITDFAELVSFLRQKAAELGIDGDRMSLWACSGNTPMALSALFDPAAQFIRCAALSYGYLLDLDGATSVSATAKTYGFANPCAGKTVGDLRKDLPLFLARAGRDELPGLNETMDRFVAVALQNNLPLTLQNHPTGPHAFDILEDSEMTREIIRQTVQFLRFHLQA